MSDLNISKDQRKKASAILQCRISGILSKKVSEFDQEIPQSQTADKPMALRGRATHQPQDTRKTN